MDIDEKAGVALQNELNGKYGDHKVKYIKCDVCNDEQLNTSFEDVLSNKNETYVVINNAGILNDSLQTYRKEIEINVVSIREHNLICSLLKVVKVVER